MKQDFFKKKKQWSKIKDFTLGNYLSPYFQKIIAFQKPLTYIDGFAGKGVFDDGEMGSPIISLKCLEKAISQTRFTYSADMFFIELKYSNELENNIKAYQTIDDINCKVINGRFEDSIDCVLSNCNNRSVFLYIDPYGIKVLNLTKLNNLSKGHFANIEMLININTWGFFREACRIMNVRYSYDSDLDAFLLEYDDLDIKNVSDLNDIAGGDYWQSIINDYRVGKIDAFEAEKRIAGGMVNHLNGFRYVLNIPITSSETSKMPKYRLFYVSNHSSGCVLMADTMSKATAKAREQHNEGQISLLDYDINGDIIDERIIKQRVLKILNGSIRLTELIAEFYTTYGICTSVSKLKTCLKEMDGIDISIKRFPAFNKNGTKKTFMDENNKQKVIISKYENN